jgi:small conductance mechanosensitive channel
MAGMLSEVLGFAQEVLFRGWAILKIAIIFVVVRFVVYKVIGRTMNTMIRRDEASGRSTAGRIRTLGSLIRSGFFYVLVFISGIMMLTVFNVHPTAVLTAAGVVGLAVGFGAQKLVKDVLAGFFIVLENQYSVGDYVTIGAVTGTVQDLGVRITRLRDDYGKLVIIPNGDISQVINHSRGPLLAVVDVSVDPKTDVEKLRALIEDAGKDVAENVEGIVSSPQAGGIVALDASKMTVRATAEVKTGRQFAVQNALREAIRGRMQEAGIDLAYEQVVKQV